jgi:UDP-N-acetylmuramyl pentapeptide phosphotransferase/UDP-N-acetylglucosamine-1-phosphate transferase
MSSGVAAFVGITALATSTAMPLVVVPLLRRHGMVDVPNHRSSHTRATIRGVGLATAIAVVAALVCAAALAPNSELLVLVLCTGVVASALGLAEDARGLSVASRVLLQIAVTAVFAVIAVQLTQTPWWLVPLVAIGLAGYINAANFMDGVDSISALHGLVAGSYFAVLGAISGQAWLLLVGVVLGAVFAGFAPWNLAPRLRVFLGDTGSYLLGALVGGSSAVVWLTGTSLLVSLAPTMVYLVDTCATVLNRLRRGERLTEAHRSHVYQRLAGNGWPHLLSGGLVAVVTASCCVAALLVHIHLLRASVATILIASVLVTYLVLPRLVTGSNRRQVAS